MTFEVGISRKTFPTYIACEGLLLIVMAVDVILQINSSPERMIAERADEILDFFMDAHYMLLQIALSGKSFVTFFALKGVCIHCLLLRMHSDNVGFEVKERSKAFVAKATRERFHLIMNHLYMF